MIFTNMNTFKEILLAHLKDIENTGFSPKKRTLDFSRKRDFLTECFFVRPFKRSNYYLVSCSVNFCQKKINKIFKTLIQDNIPLSWPTFGFPIRNKYPKRGEYFIYSEEDMNSISQEIVKDFVELALPWLESIIDFESVDALINSKSSNGKYSPFSVHSAFCGLIAAGLSENKYFEQICSDYHEFITNFDSPEKASSVYKVRDYFFS